MTIQDARLTEAQELEAKAKKLRSEVNKDQVAQVRALILEAKKEFEKLPRGNEIWSEWDHTDNVERDFETLLKDLNHWQPA